MKQEDRGLLFKDLCTRLPYKVKVECEGEICDLEAVSVDAVYVRFPGASIMVDKDISEVKPYLIPISSINEEQWEEYCDIIENWMYDITYHLDWLNERHFDYRNLIEKSIAIDATGLNIY